jgi:hypothetical protein
MTLPKEYVEYVGTLPIYRNSGIHWTIESFTQAVPLRYPGFKIVDDQVWVGARSKYKFVCPKHGEFEARACNFLLDSDKRGPGCKACQYEANSKAKRVLTLCLVGTTNSDGVIALEARWEWGGGVSIKAGGTETARLRCKCPHCDNDQWWVWANSFKKKGHSTQCGCLKNQRENINTHLNNKRKAESPCHVYIAPVWDASFTKIGIAKDFEKRSRMHEVQYETPYFLSPELPRAWCYTAEQILLRETMNELPSTPLPKEMVEVYWPGTSELRDGSIDPSMLVARFWEIIKDIESDGDWYRVYKSSFAVPVGAH